MMWLTLYGTSVHLIEITRH